MNPETRAVSVANASSGFSYRISEAIVVKSGEGEHLMYGLIWAQ
jgi:hypothetical protein